MKINKNSKNYIKIIIPYNDIEMAIEKELLAFSKTVKINGFRKGRIPLKLVKKKYKNIVEEKVLFKKMKEKFLHFILENKIVPIKEPKYYPSQYITGKDFIYFVDTEKYPTIKIKKTKFDNIKKIIVNFDKNDTQFFIDNFIDNNNWIEKEKNINIGDEITIKYDVFLENKKINLDCSVYRFFVGKNEILKKIEKKIFTSSKNEKFSVFIKIDENYPEEKIQGKKIQIAIKILSIKGKKKQKIDKIKLKSINWNDSKENFLKKINQQMELEIKNINFIYLKKQIINNLILKNPIKLPSIWIEQELKSLKIYNDYFFEKNKKNFLIPLPYNNIVLQSKNRIKSKLLLNKIIENNKIKINDKKLKIYNEKIMKKYKNFSKKDIAMKKKKIKNILLENKAIDFLIKQAKTIEKKCSFKKAIYCALNI
ncbi:trigger factor [Buchnera aphidicola (Mindarus keteleerifoliae)]|uniref:trigger factor n=1 Tax=Buchnera aphidicola TaxID=9 RepID=UPI0031B73ADA